MYFYGSCVFQNVLFTGNMFIRTDRDLYYNRQGVLFFLIYTFNECINIQYITTRMPLILTIVN